MKKRLLTILLGSALILGVATGCTEQKVDDKTVGDVEEKSKGNCEVEECMKLIDTKMELSEINEIIGFEGEKKEGTETYVWQLTSKTKIEVEFKDGKGTISATYDKDKINSADLKLSVCYEIQNSIKEGTTFTYEEMVEKFGGIEGYLRTNAPTFKMYTWVKDGQTFSATFSDSLNGKCSIVSLR